MAVAVTLPGCLRRVWQETPHAERSLGTVAVSVGPDLADAWKALDVALGWVRHAELKAATILGAAGVVGGILYSLLKADSSPSGPFTLAAAVCAAATLAAGVCSGLALRPRLRIRGRAAGQLFWLASQGGCCVHGLADLVSDREGLFAAITQQVRINSFIAYLKYRWSGAAVAAMIGSLGALGATAALGGR